MERSIEFLNELNLDKNDYIVVGCSAGPDSMCLLDLLYQNGYKIVCTHINHNIRKESAKEEEFLKKYCKKRNIDFALLKLEKSHNQDESYYRKKRYEFYKSTADKYKTNIIATAHHGDDLIETILMRITRGSNLKGYMGFSKLWQEEKYIFLKPLIYYTKDEIMSYDEKNRVTYFLDKTNEEDSYTRNRFRHHILPFLKKEEPNIAAKFLNFSEELNSACTYLNKKVQESFKDNYRNETLDLNKFLKLDEFIQRKELDYILSITYKDDINKISSAHTKKIIELLKKEKNFRYNLPEKLICFREYQKLYFKKETCQKEDFKQILTSKITLEDGSTIEIIKKSDEESNDVIRLNSESINLPIYIRNRRNGDAIEVKGFKGTQKIKKIMIDKKVPPSIRYTYPVVEDNKGNILWLPGLKKSKFDNEKNEKYDIILKYTKRKELINEKK